MATSWLFLVLHLIGWEDGKNFSRSDHKANPGDQLKQKFTLSFAYENSTWKQENYLKGGK